MMIVLLLLGVCVCVDLSHEEEYQYGDSYSMRLHRKTQSIEFTPNYNSDVTVLWKRDDPPAAEDSRHRVIGSYYKIFQVTQKDSGRYVMKDKDHKPLLTRSLDVIASSMTYSKTAGESLSFTFDGLEPYFCNIYFFRASDHERVEKIVNRGRLQPDLDELDCGDFDMLRSCGILNEGLKASCSGYFQVRDQNDNLALEVFVEIEPQPYDVSSLGIGIGVLLAVLSCCGCMKRCCCGKSSSKKDKSEAADAEPAVRYQEYETEPRLRHDQLSQPSGTHYSAQPSYTPTGPLIHNPPTEPPAYSEVSALVEQPDAQTVPVNSDPVPQFELKGMNFPTAPPLSSESTYCHIYNSDKLNFR